jgi:type IV pilus assembly protein PilC
MATFRYIARTDTGAEVTGVLQGDSRTEILLWLREKCFTPVSLQEVAMATGEKKRKGRHRLRIRSHDMASFCWQLNTMIEGGVTITDAIDTIVGDIDNRKLQDVLRQVSEKMKTGESFYESSGTLAAVLTRLADYYDRRDELNRKIKKAMAYPLFILGFVGLVLVAMMTLVIPRFLEIFNDFGSKLPAFTKGFMAVYKFVMHNFHFGLAGIAAMVILLALFDRTAVGHRLFSRMWLRLPLMGKIFRFAFVATYGRSMATLLGAGVPVLNAMEIVEGMTKNDVIRDVLVKAKAQIAEGIGVAVSMSGNAIFPSLMVRMVQVGEESGSLPQVLDRSSVHYEKQVDSTVMTMVSILEPSMIVLVGGIVLVVLLALYMPIFSMSDVTQGG